MNLLATDCAVDILRVVGWRLLVPPAVDGEALYLESADGSGNREPIDLSRLEESGVLEKVLPTDEELDLVVELAQLVDDGEAEVIALGLTRKVTIATDDRKARRVAAQRGGLLMSTPDLLHLWHATAAVTDARMSAILNMVSRRSRYRPPLDHAFYEWWMGFLTRPS